MLFFLFNLKFKHFKWTKTTLIPEWSQGGWGGGTGSHTDLFLLPTPVEATGSWTWRGEKSAGMPPIENRVDCIAELARR